MLYKRFDKLVQRNLTTYKRLKTLRLIYLVKNETFRVKQIEWLIKEVKDYNEDILDYGLRTF